MAWTPDRVATLEKLWKKGVSAAQIAETLGGVTRNAVIGKAHRLGLSAAPKKGAKAKAAAPKPTGKSTAKAAPKTVSKKAAEVAETPANTPKAKPKSSKKADDTPEEMITILTLTERMCKWPINHPGDDDFHFCGGKALPGQPYCGRHAAMAYQAPQPRRDRRDRTRPRTN